MASKTIYRVRGGYWQQGPLMYGEWLECMRLLKGRFTGLQTDGLQGIATLLDEMSQDGTLQKLAAIVVKPYEPTFVHRWRNRRAEQKHGVTAENILSHMPAAEVARLGLDFFRINIGLILRLLSGPMNLGSLLRRKTFSGSELATTFLKVFGTLQAATSPGPSKSNGDLRAM